MVDNYGVGPFPGCCISHKTTSQLDVKNWRRNTLYAASNEKKPSFSLDNIVAYKGNKVTFYLLDVSAYLKERYPDAWKRHVDLMKDRENLTDFKFGDRVCCLEYDGDQGTRVVLSVTKYTVTVTMNNRTTADMGSLTFSIFQVWRK